MFKAGDYVDYNNEVLEIVVVTDEKLLLREPRKSIFDKPETEMFTIAKIEDCRPLPF